MVFLTIFYIFLSEQFFYGYINLEKYNNLVIYYYSRFNYNLLGHSATVRSRYGGDVWDVLRKFYVKVSVKKHSQCLKKIFTFRF